MELIVLCLLSVFLVSCAIRCAYHDEPEPKPEPDRFTYIRLQSSLYIVDRTSQTVLDVGRALVLNFNTGLVTEPNQDILTWESKRRIVASSPTINMRIVRDALGAGEGPALPMGKANWLPTWEDEDE